MAYVLPEDDNPMVQQGGVQSPAQQVVAPTSNGFISWDRILNANKDAAQKASEAAAKKLESSAQDVQSKLTQGQQAFSNSMQPYQQGPKNIGQTQTGKPGAKQSINQFGQPTSTPTPMPTVYAGPNSLADATQDWQGLQKSAQEASQNIGLMGQRDVNGNLMNNAGLATQGGSQLAGALMGSVGRGRFEGLQRDYGDLLGKTNAANEASKAQVAKVKGAIDTANAATAAKNAKIASDLKDIQTKDAAAAKAKGDLQQQGKDLDAKHQKWLDYVGNNQAEGTVRDVAEALDPIAHIAKAMGWKTPEQLTTPAMEGVANKSGASLNSNKVRWNEMPGTDEEHEAVFRSLSDDDLKQLENMPTRDQQKYVSDRLQSALQQKQQEEQDFTTRNAQAGNNWLLNAMGYRS